MNWKNESVLVTGGAGFLGRVVVRKLRERGCRSIFIPRKAEVDLVDPSAVDRLLADTKPSLTIHLAGVCGGIGINKARPADFFYQNLMMGVQLMDKAYRAGVEKFVAIGTICAYPKNTPVPFSENDLWNGYPEETNAPYGLAKKMLLVQAQAYRAQYGFNAVYLLPVNLYGPGDNFDLQTSHVIPALIRKFVEAREKGASKVVCWGTGRASREFLYVDDAAEGICAAAEKFNSSEPVNLGSGNEVSIYDLAHRLKEQTGFKGDIEWDASKPDGQPRRRLNTERAAKLFGFKAKVSLEEGLSRTVRWFEETNEKLSSRPLTQ